MPAYERLRKARRTPEESFSQVVLRAEWPETSISGAELLRVMEKDGPAYDTGQLEAVEDAKAADRPPRDKWKSD